MGAIPATVLVWTVLTAVLTAVLADLALGGVIACGLIALVSCVLLVVPHPTSRGIGLGAVVTLVPCVIGLALSLM